MSTPTTPEAIIKKSQFLECFLRFRLLRLRLEDLLAFTAIAIKNPLHR
jgi:hypothetical protein